MLKWELNGGIWVIKQQPVRIVERTMRWCNERIQRDADQELESVNTIIPGLMTFTGQLWPQLTQLWLLLQSKYCQKGDMEMKVNTICITISLSFSIFMTTLGLTFNNIQLYHTHFTHSEFGVDHMRSYQFWVEPN